MAAADSFYQRAPLWLKTVLLNAHALRIQEHRYGAGYRLAVERLLEQEQWPRAQLQELQNRRLRRVVRTAFTDSPYYRKVMLNRGLRPSAVQTTDDLPKLPILDRQQVRAKANELLTARKPRRSWWLGRTSGTTGTPLTVWYDRNMCLMNNAVDRRFKTWAGMAWDDWIGLFLGRMVIETGRRAPPFWRTNWIQKQVWFSSFHLSPKNLPAYVDEIRKRKLRFLEGYPSTLFILANHLVTNGLTLPMHSVITSSETLHDVQREVIEQAFECRVFDFYAMAERVVFAGDCEAHDGKHVAEEYGYVEIVDDSGERVDDGKTGFIVGSSLLNTAMPLLRYRLNDVTHIIRAPCTCGRTLIRIGDVATKAEDLITTPDGRWISPSIMTHPFKSLQYVDASQIIQTSHHAVTIKVVTPSEEAFRKFDEAELRNSLRLRLGSEMQIEVVTVDAIERERSGKFRWIISEVGAATHLSWRQPQPR